MAISKKLEIIYHNGQPNGIRSMFVLGGSTNGWLEWKNHAGKTLDELFRKP